MHSQKHQSSVSVHIRNDVSSRLITLNNLYLQASIFVNLPTIDRSDIDATFKRLSLCISDWNENLLKFAHVAMLVCRKTVSTKLTEIFSTLCPFGHPGLKYSQIDQAQIFGLTIAHSPQYSG